MLTTLLYVGGGLVALCLYLRNKYPWLALDIKYITRIGKVLLHYRRYARQEKYIVDIIADRAIDNPTKVFLAYEEELHTYSEVDKQINRVANLAYKKGWKCGDVAAMLVKNEPAFVTTSYGLLRNGMQPAYLNTNLRTKSLFHCFQVSGATVLIVGQDKDLIEAVVEIQKSLEELKVEIYVLGNPGELPPGFTRIQEDIDKSPDTAVPRSRRDGIDFMTPACYIYTSGTTGLPKAAVVTHAKMVKGGLFLAGTNATPADVIYAPLPLYHSAAGLVAIGNAIVLGSTFVIRQKFSASHFWEDCRKHNVTVVQYIGELARYLLAQPKSSSDKDHQVRIMLGNGMRADIWKEFQDRFGVEQVVEFYAATEGNGGFVNYLNKQGSVGRSSPFMRLIYPTYFVKYNFETAEPLRGIDGRCIQVKPGEPGLLICKIRRDLEYDGYKGNKELTEKKIVKNVFKNGDQYFNTGDLLVFDKDYFLYFNDRLGDTFRWKGENVSTIEVANVICDIPWVHDANVYGVEVKGQDGRAGMAAIMLEPDREHSSLTKEDLKKVYDQCEDFLPTYARPRFLRLTPQIEMTASFKNRKVEAVKEGFNPDLCQGEPIYYMDMAHKTFSPVDKEAYENIINGNIRL